MNGTNFFLSYDDLLSILDVETRTQLAVGRQLATVEGEDNVTALWGGIANGADAFGIGLLLTIEIEAEVVEDDPVVFGHR